MATNYSLDGERIGVDGASSITWNVACEISETGWGLADQAIISVNIFSSSHTPATESFKLRWRNATDGGSFADCGGLKVHRGFF